MKKEIIVELESLEEATSSFNSNLLSQELDDYFFQNCFEQKKDFKLVIKGISKQEEQLILTNLIHNYYIQKEDILKKQDQRYDRKRLLLFIVGILFLIISYYLESIMSDILSVATWVVMWESIYDLLFTNLERKSYYRMYKKLATCDIIFED